MVLASIRVSLPSTRTFAKCRPIVVSPLRVSASLRSRVVDVVVTLHVVKAKLRAEKLSTGGTKQRLERHQVVSSMYGRVLGATMCSLLSL